MAKNEKYLHPNFVKYMEMIASHPNYDGLPILKKNDGTLSWVATAKSLTGKKRIEWCQNKAKVLGLEIKPGFYAEVMLEIHPTKSKVCQICGREMSLFYHYPNSNLLNKISKKFAEEYTSCTHIGDIWSDLLEKGISQQEISAFFIGVGALRLSPSSSSKNEIIMALEKASRLQGKKLLGPGAMSNFPDRYDGFHSYNRCCRSEQDSGRSKENLKSYTIDRRAYEYWSDGNIRAANQYMGSDRFIGTSADHIGPISLGFIHDPLMLQPLPNSLNSSKRDHLEISEIRKIIEIEQASDINAMSWYSQTIWNFIKENYLKYPSKVDSEYKAALKQNLTNYMYIISKISSSNHGVAFLKEELLSANLSATNYSYTLDSSGFIINEEIRHKTDRASNETARYMDIAISSAQNFEKKSNRNLKNDLTDNEKRKLDLICESVSGLVQHTQIRLDLNRLIETIQRRIISEIC